MSHSAISSEGFTGCDILNMETKFMTFSNETLSHTYTDSHVPYHLRLATPEDAYAICTIMDTCFQALEHKEYFICDDFDYVTQVLQGQGFGVVACHSTGQIVGNLLITYPGLKEDNLGYDVFPKKESPSASSTLPLLSEEHLNRVLHMDSCSVLPMHRGHGLEGKMIAFAETLINTSQHRYSFATVAPKNTASLKTLEKCGYRIMVTKEKYNGYIRHVMMKELI